MAILIAGAIVLLLVLTGMVILFCYNAALQKKQASFVQENTIEFVMAGKKRIRILDNIPGWHFDWDETEYGTIVGRLVTAATDKTPAVWEPFPKKVTGVKGVLKPNTPDHRTQNPFRHYLRHDWGFYWVSVAYPARQIHEFKVIKTRLKRDFVVGEQATSLTDMIERDGEPATVKWLMWRFPRAIIVKDIEFSDRLTASLLVMVEFRVVIPETPVFVYGTDYFPQLESVIQSAVIEYCRMHTLKDFITASPLGPGSNFFLEVVSQVNPLLVKVYGTEATDSWIGTIVQGDAAQIAALKANELAARQGEAAVTTAEKNAEAAVKTAEGAARARLIEANAEANAKRQIGQAEADALKSKKEAVGEGVTIADLQKQGLEKFQGQVLSQGGGTGTMVNVPITPPVKPENN